MKKTKINIEISKSIDCLFDGEKLANILRKYRWVEFAFNKCYYDKEKNEIFFYFSHQAKFPTLYPNLITNYYVKYDDAEREKEVSDVFDYDDSDLTDVATCDIEFLDLVNDVSACIDVGSIEISLTHEEFGKIQSELIHIDYNNKGYRKTLTIDDSVNRVYSYEVV
jgi:hypothetical protein